MTMVFLGVGSNTDREHFLGRGLDALEQLLGPLDVSPVFESDAVGVLGRRFLNMIVGAETHLPLSDLASGLKAIEAACGRRDSPSPSRITLDIDVLTYGNLAGEHQGLTLPRPEVRRNAFVLWPLALLAPHAILPGSGHTHAELWADWQGNQALWPVAFEWRGRALTPVELIQAHALRSTLGR
ncbi:2-amino-4-hydroxy-6-hydroxymethyldihydropteridine diphosphokinase [Halopseudomonas laoshanensis]|uniref:2-amino-4-hydroxy-6-hydroxymethyldihydropteridine diphosphokinase n=1 Tax=Halopseudomonas laoshanensis TaxID=2268758 RepID=A0A7V7KY18_9GAMM|nr:2-amino-4-hydroxy-6-hydroxymethyldihydropteridine diphosphokinase [Halopseudomonas laoshanensis]KAA0695236.1 2-amino-4-hydroxy-6-hydroxymethyldihydropteridine diphosphokinase [Halopseudomonas laoshanensis]